jgi:hypothetical protein
LLFVCFCFSLFCAAQLLPERVSVCLGAASSGTRFHSPLPNRQSRLPNPGHPATLLRPDTVTPAGGCGSFTSGGGRWGGGTVVLAAAVALAPTTTTATATTATTTRRGQQPRQHGGSKHCTGGAVDCGAA